jgi:thiol-disulfide isomerase/thioredoxin
MTRRQVIGFAVVLGLIAAALVVRSLGRASSDPRLPGLREAAALEPCPPGLGREIPAVTLPCLGGGAKVPLRGKAPGRPTLVNIWGSWCPPCTAEVPYLVAFATRSGGKVGLVGVDTEDDPDQALTFAAQVGMHWPSVVDDNKDVLRYYGPGPPVTLFLDATGHITYTQVGQFHSLTQIEQLVSTHLGVQL